MIGLLLIGAAVATAVFVAAAARLSSLVSTLLLAYLAFAANLALTTLALSPLHQVTRGGLAVSEAALLVGALAAWWLRGRPGLPLAGAARAGREACADPVTAVFLVVVVLLLLYELGLALTVPPNNGDALGYHMPRAAAWAQHGGIHWIANAPTVRMNAFQPLAEQELLYLFVAAGGGALFALPQYLAELAILVAVYGTARRLGFEVRAAAAGALLLATFSVVALEATTAQNDLVAASFPAVAACLLLGEGRLEPALAGAAASFGLGAKLTTALVLPVLGWVALARGRRVLGAAALGGALGFVAVGMWGYVLNVVHSGAVLGAGTAQVEDRGSPSYPGSVANAFYLMYGTMDASVLSSTLIHALAAAGVALGVAAASWALLRRAGARRALGAGAKVATPFLAPLLVIGAAGALAAIARRWGFPIRGAGGIVEPLDEILNAEYTRIANESYSAFGPVGIVALLAAAALAVREFVARRLDARHLALASALPAFLILMALWTTWNPFLVRFFIVPAVLTAPLLALLFRSRAASAAYLAVAAVTVGLTLAHDQTKPLQSANGFGRPWNLSQVDALSVASRPDFAGGLAAFEARVPPDACVGAALETWEPSYVLFGPRLRHHVVYLSPENAVFLAVKNALPYVVVGGPLRRVADDLAAVGWQVRPLGTYWLLASKPHGKRACGA